MAKWLFTWNKMLFHKANIKGCLITYRSRVTWGPDWQSFTVMHWWRSLPHVILFSNAYWITFCKEESWLTVILHEKKTSHFAIFMKKIADLCMVHGYTCITELCFRRKEWKFSCPSHGRFFWFETPTPLEMHNLFHDSWGLSRITKNGSFLV